MEILKIKINEQDRKLLSDFMGESYPLEIDFNWLMPVVEKIAVETKHPTYLYFSHIQNSAIIHELKQDYAIIRESETRRMYTPLQVTYQAVIEFIKWHKTQPNER